MHSTNLSQAFARRLKILLGGATLTAALLSGGCESMSRVDEGILGGGVIGAALGTVVGAATGHPGAGMAIGAASGAVLGGATGAAIDNAERRQEIRQVAAEQQRRALSLYDVAKLTASGTQEAVIINQIRSSGAVYSLTADDIIYLQNNRVSDTVISEMQQTAMRPPATVIHHGPPPCERVYIYDPYPPPPRIGVGVRFGRRW